MTAIRGLADRLNLIQRETGHRKSMRAFREALRNERFWQKRGKRPPSFSEEAMRNYHLRREPPVVVPLRRDRSIRREPLVAHDG